MHERYVIIIIYERNKCVYVRWRAEGVVDLTENRTCLTHSYSTGEAGFYFYFHSFGFITAVGG